ncbi:MAG: O-antigen ligase family protein [Solirubrobacteraceae bacterium]
MVARPHPSALGRPVAVAGLAGLAVGLGVLAGLNPEAAVAASLGCVFVAAVLSNLLAGVYLFGLVAFLEVLPGLGGGVSFAKFAGALLAVSWLATLTSRREMGDEFPARHPTATWVGALFLAWATLSLLWAPEVGTGLEALTRYALNLLLVVILFSAIRTRRHVLVLIAILVGGALLSGAYGLLVAHAGTVGEGSARLGGAGVDANFLAALLVAALVLAATLASLDEVARSGRLVAGLCVVLAAAGVAATVSRSGLVSLAVVLLAGLALAGRGRRLGMLALAVVAVASFTAYFTAVAPREDLNRIQHAGDEGRLDLYTIAWRMIEAHPVEGVGVGNFTVASVDYLLRPGAIERSEFIVDTPKATHNTYLQVGAEMGVVGLALFVFLLGFAIRCALEAARRFGRAGDPAMDLVSRGVAVAALGVLASNLFVSEQFSKPLWLLLGLGPVLLAIARRETAARDVAA